MIIQILLDWLSDILATTLSTFPAYPPEAVSLASQFAAIMNQATDIVAPFGRFVPWNAIQGFVSFYGVILVFWLGSVIVRFFLWLFGR